MIVTVRIERVTLDTASNRFVVILKDDSHERWLPIVVGPAEAQAIALQLEHVSTPRPMTHDLLRNILNVLQAEVTKVVINSLRDNTYFASIDFKTGSNSYEIDARPSDAIAIALRTDTPIFVDEQVMKKAAIFDTKEEIVEPPREEEELKNLNIDLMTAVKEERYEDAARIRDQINALKNKLNLPEDEEL